MIRPILKLMRPHQYIKNNFVFAGVLFAHQWTYAIIYQALAVFVAFCCIASSVYILNDIIDLENDRAHPHKSNRPLPKGEISISLAILLLAILLICALYIASLASYYAVFCIVFYFILNIFYSLYLKNIVILDVVTISIGFMCRIYIGTLGLNITPSKWLLICGLMITLFLGFSKRFSEIRLIGDMHKQNKAVRPVLSEYNTALLEQFMVICATCSIMCYGLYATSFETIKVHNTENMVYSLPFVVYGVLRYFLIVYKYEAGADTSRDILTDKHMFITILAWISAMIWILM